MPNSLPRVQIEYTPEFKRNLSVLAKKYRHIRSDVQPIIEQIQDGNFIGDYIPGVPYVVFKVRMKNSDMSEDKRMGYRLIYYAKASGQVVLLTLYSKLDQPDKVTGKAGKF